MTLEIAVWLTQVLSDVTPTPVPEFTGNEDLVTPGVVGFIVTFLIAVATVLLVIDMTRRVRRVRYRAEVQEQLEAERAAAADPKASSAPKANPAQED